MAHCSQHSQYPVLNYGSGAKWIKNLTRSRLSNFLGGHFQDFNLSSKLFIHRLDGPGVVDLHVWSAPGLTKPLFCEAMQQTFKPAKKGDSLGPSCKMTFHVPGSCTDSVECRGIDQLRLLCSSLMLCGLCRPTIGGKLK